MFLKSIILHNFRCFSDLEVKFNNRLTVVVGNNGAGKSTVLEAATIAAGTLSSAKEMTSIAKEYQERMRNGDKNLLLPIISYYGTGRLWDQHREKKKDTFEKNNRSNGYIDSLDGAANDKLMMKWFQKMTLQQLQRGEEIPKFTAVRTALEQIFASITGYSEVKVQYNLDTNEIDIIYYDNNAVPARIPLSQLSDGYKCTISLIADIAYRMAILNPQLLDRVLVETEGVVLIDEVDLHLHPKWQKRILKDLINLFPKVQFIVNTHAPEVINSVKSESIVSLKEQL